MRRPEQRQEPESPSEGEIRGGLFELRPGCAESGAVGGSKMLRQEQASRTEWGAGSVTGEHEKLSGRRK